MDPKSCLYEKLGPLPKPTEETVKTLKEIIKFLEFGARIDLKAVALDTLLALSGTEDGARSILSVSEILISLVCLLQDNNKAITKDAASCLINLSADKYGPRELLNLDKEFCPRLQTKPKSIVDELFKHVFNPNSHLADQCCMILSNLSRDEDAVKQTYELLQDTEFSIDSIINVFTKVKYNNKGAHLNYLGPWLSNMTQDNRVRKHILEAKNIVNNLMTYTQYQESIVKRGGTIGALRNCCFDVSYNEWLLHEVDILPSLLLPLAGNEEFDDEDNDKLPDDLQYLPETKKRESDPDIRKMLVEAITQLCTEKKNREYVRDKNTYVILRELHKWEKDPVVLVAVENLVDILIRTEDEIGLDNLKNLEIPKDVEEKLRKIDIQSESSDNK